MCVCVCVCEDMTIERKKRKKKTLPAKRGLPDRRCNVCLWEKKLEFDEIDLHATPGAKREA